VDKLSRDIVAIMKEPDTARKFANQGADIVTSSPEEFERFVQSELTKWSAFIKAAKITAD
jgi:tripartite-type tricarboxylate transporter receptor subunit TctC